MPEGSKPPGQGDAVQIMGLEILTDVGSGPNAAVSPMNPSPDNTATAGAAPRSGGARQQQQQQQRQQQPQKHAKKQPQLSPKSPGMARFIGLRGGKKKLSRTKSMPTTATSSSRKSQQPSSQQPENRKNAAPTGGRSRGSSNLSPVRPSNSRQQQQQQQQQQRGGGRKPMTRAASARQTRGRRSSMGMVQGENVGGQAFLPRVMRRVSIGNDMVGVTQTTWGLKPQRRASQTGGGGNYHYAQNSQVQAPRTPQQQQRQQQRQYNHHHNQVVNVPEDHDDSFSRRSSLSSHGSEFSELGISELGASGGTESSANAGAQANNQQQIMRRLSNDSGFTDYSYANDSLDLRNKKAKKTNNIARNPPRGQNEYGYDDDDYDSMGDDDTYAADSLDLRQYNKKKQGGNSNNNNNSNRPREYSEYDDFDDSLGYDDNSYAADSLDLRRKSSQVRHINDRRLPEEYDDDDDFDDVSYAADSVDLRRKSSEVKHISQHEVQELDTSRGGLDDSAASSAFSCAADSLDMRKVGNKIHARHIPSRDDLGYGDDDGAPTAADLGYGDDADLGYGNAAPSAADLGYGRDEPKNTRSAPSAQDLGYGVDEPKHTRPGPSAEDLGYGFDEPKNTRSAPSAADLGYGDEPKITVPPKGRRLSTEELGFIDDSERKTGSAHWQDDDDSFGSFSYAADSLDLRTKRKGGTATAQTASTADADDDSYYDDDDSDYASSGTGTVESTKTPVDYMTRIVMGYSKKQKAPAPTPADDDEDDDSSSSSSDDADSGAGSNKTPIDYMTQIVLGYAKTEEGGTSAMGRRNSNESTADSVYSYACDSVVMKPKTAKQTGLSKTPVGMSSGLYANRGGYDDDDCSDYSDDDDSHGREGGGKNPYLSGVLGYGAQNKPQIQHSVSLDTGMERRLSCDSYANDSVDMRRKGGDKEPSGGNRRESMDSLVSGISTTDLDADYLNSVLGYAMDASSSSANGPNDANTDSRAYPVALERSNLMDSITSIGSGSEGDYWALSPSAPPAKKVSVSATRNMHSSLGKLDAEDTSHSEGLGYEDMGM